MNSEVKNEGLEVVLSLFHPDTGWGSEIEPLCRHSEALALVSGLRERVAELEAENEALNVWRDLALQFDNHRMAALWHLKKLVSAPQSSGRVQLFLSEPPRAAHEVVAERDQLRAELAAVKSDYCEAIADGTEMRKELDAIKAQEPIGWYTDDYLTDKSSTTYDWGVAERWETKGWPLFPLYATPVAKQVVIPQSPHWPGDDSRLTDYERGELQGRCDMRSEVIRLNAADEEGGAA